MSDREPEQTSNKMLGGIPWLSTRVDFGYNSRRQVHDMVRKKIVLRDHMILEVGCGNGNFLIELLGQLHPKLPLYGTDTSEKNLSEFQQKIKKNKIEEEIKVYNTGPDSLPFENEFFDVITLNYIVKHFKDVDFEGVFMELKRVLKHGGKIIIHEFSPYPNPVKTRRTEEIMDGAKLRTFDELKRLIQKAGLENIKETFYGTRWWPPIPKVGLTVLKE